MKAIITLIASYEELKIKKTIKEIVSNLKEELIKLQSKEDKTPAELE
jgi:hypothetical protein